MDEKRALKQPESPRGNATWNQKFPKYVTNKGPANLHIVNRFVSHSLIAASKPAPDPSSNSSALTATASTTPASTSVAGLTGFGSR